MSETNKPEFKVKYGSVEANVWKQKGEKGDFYTISCHRSYLDKEEKWQNTNSYRTADVLNLVLAVQEAYKFTKTKKEN